MTSDGSICARADARDARSFLAEACARIPT